MILRRNDFEYHEKQRNMFGIFIKNIERDCKNSTKLYNKGEKMCSKDKLTRSYTDCVDYMDELAAKPVIDP